MFGKQLEYWGTLERRLRSKHQNFTSKMERGRNAVMLALDQQPPPLERKAIVLDEEGFRQLADPATVCWAQVERACGDWVQMNVAEWRGFREGGQASFDCRRGMHENPPRFDSGALMPYCCSECGTDGFKDYRHNGRVPTKFALNCPAKHSCHLCFRYRLEEARDMIPRLALAASEAAKEAEEEARDTGIRLALEAGEAEKEAEEEMRKEREERVKIARGGRAFSGTLPRGLVAERLSRRLAAAWLEDETGLSDADLLGEESESFGGLVGKLPDEHWRLLAEIPGAGRLGA